MKAEQGRVDANWKSPAGMQYQSRLQNDIAVLENILTQLDERTSALQKALECYISCEDNVQKALGRLPNLQ
jgi:exonuclease VII small subunit